MTKSTITRERLEELAAGQSGFNLRIATHEESQELACMALAAMDSESVILYRERNPYNGLTTGWQELTENELSFLKENAGENAEFLTLYRHAQPAPVVPGEVASAIEALKRTLVDCNRYNYCSDAVARVESACRAAMLQGAENSESRCGIQTAPVLDSFTKNADTRCGNSPAIPDGYVMVPKEPTKEMIDAGWLHFIGTKHPSSKGTYKSMLAAAPQDTPAMDSVQSVVTVSDTWIPVSERLPEEGGRYWCYVEEQNDLGKSHYQWNCSWNGERWWVESENGGIVTHWMPLPAAPQEVK